MQIQFSCEAVWAVLGGLAAWCAEMKGLSGLGMIPDSAGSRQSFRVANMLRSKRLVLLLGIVKLIMVLCQLVSMVSACLTPQTMRRRDRQ